MDLALEIKALRGNRENETWYCGITERRKKYTVQFTDKGRVQNLQTIHSVQLTQMSVS